jgi:hypothetical protein
MDSIRSGRSIYSSRDSTRSGRSIVSSRSSESLWVNKFGTSGNIFEWSFPLWQMSFF